MLLGKLNGLVNGIDAFLPAGVIHIAGAFSGRCAGDTDCTVHMPADAYR